MADVSELDIGDAVKISAIKLPEGTRPTIIGRDFTVATIAGRSAKDEVVDEKPVAAAAAEGAEGAAGARAAGAAPALRRCSCCWRRLRCQGRSSGRRRESCSGQAGGDKKK